MSVDLFGGVSTIDTGLRSDHDFYETPAWMTRALLRAHPAILLGPAIHPAIGRGPAAILEPCCGRGAIVRELQAAGALVFTNDLDRRHGAMTHCDATRAGYWTVKAPAVEWVVTNVPFNVAFPLLVLAHGFARVGVALLLRKTFLEPTEERGAWLALHPPTRIVGLPRHNFRGAGSDSVSCDWFIWEHTPDRSLPPVVIDAYAKQR